MKRRNGFTLIELLVVIAIIGLLLAVLIPSLQTAKQMAMGAVCLANMRGVSLAFYQYAEDNDGKVAWSNQGPDLRPDGTPRPRWVNIPCQINTATGAVNNTGHDSTVDEEQNGIMAGVLFPYSESVKVYHCPGDKRFRKNVRTRGKGGYRSYGMPVTIGSPAGQDSPVSFTLNLPSGRTTPIRGFLKYGEVNTPGDKYFLVEENYTHGPGTPATATPDVGFNTGAWDIWRNNNAESWWDPLAPWHNNRTNLGFMDGHAEKLVWKDERTVKYAHDRMHPDLGGSRDACALQVGNPDLAYMTQAYPRANN